MELTKISSRSISEEVSGNLLLQFYTLQRNVGVACVDIPMVYDHRDERDSHYRVSPTHNLTCRPLFLAYLRTFLYIKIH